MPNTTVKTRPADGTALETVRESRRPPGFLSKGEAKKKAWAAPGRVREGTAGGMKKCRGCAGRTLKTAYTKASIQRTSDGMGLNGSGNQEGNGNAQTKDRRHLEVLFLKRLRNDIEMFLEVW